MNRLFFNRIYKKERHLKRFIQFQNLILRGLRGLNSQCKFFKTYRNYNKIKAAAILKLSGLKFWIGRHYSAGYFSAGIEAIQSCDKMFI